MPQATVTIDVQPKLGSKPDKGSFVVEVKGKKVVELIAMPRPFQKVRCFRGLAASLEHAASPRKPPAAKLAWHSLRGLALPSWLWLS